MFMSIYIAFLKAINVGGKNILPMAELRQCVSNIGGTNISTYIQSGNCVFEAENLNPETLALSLEDAIFEAKGFRPSVLVLSLARLQNMIENNPYQVDLSSRNKLHFHFAIGGEGLQIDPKAVDRWQSQGEEVTVADHVLYFYAPEGVGRSKLFAKLPKLTACELTARNFNTVMKMRALGQALLEE